MSDTATRPTSPIAVVGVGAIMPDAPDADAFWANITGGRYSISDVPPERWDPALYYSPDHDEPDKTYSKVGGWVRDFPWDPIRWKLPIPPKVADQMDDGQRWAIAAARAALVDAGWPDWKTDPDNVAVIIGNAIGGEKHYQTNMRIELPEVLRDLQEAESFAALSTEQREHILDETRSHFLAHYGEINEDTMPGELANVMAGRIANLFNFRGPNFTTDAACASGLAAMSVAVDGLVDHRFDAAITGGIDHNMGVAAFVKFCKIGALSATGTRPFDAGADGFVMGEGAALFVLKRLEDAERDGDRIYAVILGIAGSSDGKGKGITAPNPIGQRLAVERAWRAASEDPGTVDAIEAHGTSTRVGDATELQSLTEVFGTAGAGPQSIALGSVKSNIGHLKAAAGAAGAFKMVRSLHDKVLAPSLNFNDPNPNVDWDTSPFVVNTALRDWPEPPSGVRRGGVSAFGFGGTNFHVVLEEHVPGRHKPAPRVFAGASVGHGDSVTPANEPGRTSVAVTDDPSKPPPRGALVLGGRDDADLLAQVRQALADAQAGRAAAPTRPDPAVGRAARRIAVDFADAADLATKLDKAVKALTTDNPAIFRMLRQQGVFVGGGPAPKVAFLYTGQGSQYVNMLQALRTSEPIVDDTFREADEVMTPLLGRPLSSYIFVDGEDPAAVAQLEQQLLQTEITQPAVLATDSSISRLLGAYGMHPDMVMGHSLGEYGALIAAGSLTFAAALEAVSARGREMARLSVDDNGAMAAVFGPLTEIERIVDATPGYVVVANINSNNQAVVGGATDAVLTAIESFTAAGMQAVRIPVSHAFHTTIVAPASVPLVATLERLDVQPPRIPLVANVTGEFYPSDATSETMREYLGRQVASPVQFVKGLQTLYDAGARVFVEVGPKRALHGFVEDVLGEHDDVLSLYTNHPKLGDAVSINQALCGLWATGVGFETPAAPAATPSAAPAATTTVAPAPTAVSGSADDRIMQLGQLFAGVIEEGLRIYGAEPATPTAPEPSAIPAASGRRVDAEPVVVTGAALGLPGVEQTFDDANIARILDGQQFIDTLPDAARARMADMHITRLVKSESGGANFETIDDPAEVIKLAGRHAPLDIVEQFAVDTARDEALDNTTRLAIGAGFDALRDAGIPLVMRYKTTTLGTQLPDRWGLPDELRDDTGVIFASAFPGYDRFAEDVEAYTADRARREHLLALEGVRARMDGTEPAVAEVDRLIANLRAEMEAHPYGFDRRFLFRVLSMGHSQFAEIIGARGPNTQVNAACASTTQAISLAEDWIRAGRCRRVVVVSADDATADSLMPWIASGFLASGAAATDEHVEDAATPFDRRRHGMIVGMGAASLVVESAEAARERGLQPICEVLGAITANSAFHGTRLDVEHIGAVMEAVIEQAESRGVRRSEIAGEAMFVSHETYTPARGGSAAAEINALRRVFGPDADRVVITNTKGFTGHAMGAGIEDVVAVKALETGIVPPVPNYREPDPDLGNLNLSHGGAQPVRYGLRLAAGFGSQVAMALLRWTPLADGRHRSPDQLGYAYRIVDAAAWQRWLDLLAGHDGARLETDHRRLRVVDVGAPATSQHESAVPVPYAGQLGASALRTLPAATTPPPADAAPPPVPAPEPVLAAPTEAVVAAAPAAVASAPEPAATPAVDDVLAQVTAVVAEMTGYPTELLEPDLDLEADLGVDTVKQAEVFAAVRTHYELERDDNLQLRDFPTLRHVAEWVRERAGLDAAAPTAAEPGAASVSASASEPAVVVAVDDVLAQVTAVVAEMTGYPMELLEPDLDLEADLGVDTVKQAEVFAAVRTQYELERDDNLQLRDFPTLRHVADWVRARAGLDTPAPAGGTPATAGGAPATAAAPAAPRVVHGDFDAVDALPRRIPVPSLRPPVTDCLPTGVALDGARIIVMLDEGGVGEALVKQLDKAGAEVLTLEPGTATDALLAQVEAWHADAPITGVYWLPALDDDGDLAEYDLPTWREALRRRVKTLYATMRCLYDASPFLVSATRLGGYHGYDADGATNPLGGPVTGFTKSYRKERPEALVKAVDLAPSRKTSAIAAQLIEETLFDPGCVEIGRVDDRRFGVGFVEAPFPPRSDDGQPLAGSGMTLGHDSVVVVTGAAGSIVSAITADLAAASGGTFHLLDLTPTPDASDPDLEAFRADRNGLKVTIAERMKVAGDHPTPVTIERELARFERLDAALTAIQSVEAAGGTVHYHSVDLTDADAVAAAIDDVRRLSGRIDVLLHAAGLEISRNLPDKETREYDLVFDVKSDGWFNVFHAAQDMEIGATVVFSSVAGRFGNQGQTDYSAANDLLCKITSNFRRSRPETRGLALDWTAWGGIGMATRGSIPKIMEMAGVQMLPPEAGVAWIRRELLSSEYTGEVIVAGALGMMATEYDDRGGVDLTSVVGDGVDRGPMIGHAVVSVHHGVVVETTLDPLQQPFLHDHRIDGTPVLPGVMGMEAFAETARLLAPDHHVLAVEDVSFAAPLKFYRDEPRTLTVQAVLTPDGDGLEAQCTLSAERQLPGRDEPQRTVHFTGRVRLGPEAPATEQIEPPGDPTGSTLGAEQVYSFYFHGPAYQVVSEAWRDGDASVATLMDPLPDNHVPPEQPLATAPRLIELCFQTAGLWQAGLEDRLALPMRVGRARWYATPEADAPLRAVARETAAGVFDCVVVDSSGTVVARLDRYETIPLPAPIPDSVAGALHATYRV
jgi:acyl transferase domain-containing protein